MVWAEVTHFNGRNYLTTREFCFECGEVLKAERKEIP